MTRAALAALLAVAFPCSASGRWALQWSQGPGTESCADAAALARAVEKRVGHPVFTQAEHARWTLEASVTRVEDRWETQVTLLDAAGTVLGLRKHRVRAPTCAALDDALTLILALFVDSSPAEPTPDAMPPPETAPPLTAVTPEAPPALVRVPPRPPVPLPVEGQLAAAGRVGLGQLHGVAAGVELRGLLLFHDIWGIELAAEAWLPSTLTVANQSVSESALGFRAAACPRVLHWRALQLTACAGVLVGLLQLDSASLSLAQPLVPRLDGVLDGHLSVRLTSALQLDFGLGGGVRVLRPIFVFSDASSTTALLPTGLWTFDAGLGLSVRL